MLKRLLFATSREFFFVLLETDGISEIVAQLPRTRQGQAAAEVILDVLMAVYSWPVEVLPAIKEGL